MTKSFARSKQERRVGPDGKPIEGTPARDVLDQLYASREVVTTTRTPGGQLIDWIPIESQLPPGERLKEFSDEPPVAEPDRGERPFELVRFELEQPDAVLGPPGTVPVQRLDLDRVDPTVTFEELFERPKFLPGEKDVAVAKAAAGGTYRYASSTEERTSFGADGYISTHVPYSEHADDTSVMQLAVLGHRNGVVQTVEVGWHTSKNFTTDWFPHLFVFFTTNGHTAYGNNIQSYNKIHQGFVQLAAPIYPGALIPNTSSPGGTQFTIRTRVVLDSDRDWRVYVNDSLIGYYPHSLFDRGTTAPSLARQADEVYFYGEVFDTDKKPGRTTTDMGSGYWPAAGFAYCAFQSNLRRKISWTQDTWVNFASTRQEVTSLDMYGLFAAPNSPSDWHSFQYVGGPGSDIYPIPVP